MERAHHEPGHQTGDPCTRKSASVTPETLTSAQLHALFDILTHDETYAEVESFKHPATISGYGYPFAQRSSGDSTSTPTYATDSSAPLLAGVLRSIVLSFPGVRDLPPEFWHVRFQGILEKLAEANLSESYDKGSLGTRKTLATAASSIHEAVSRGILGGISKGEKRDLDEKYDRSQARELERAWEDAVHELLYGDLIDELFRCAAERKSLEEHSSGVQAAVDYVIIHLATLLHHVFVLTPEGPYLLKLMENVHKLLPYSMVKQTLRIGNAATMINGMMRLLLAKVGVGAISNWVGLTQDADDGMNLLQRIISMVLSWDNAESRKTVDKIEKSRGQPAASKGHLDAIKAHLEIPRDEQEAARSQSMRTPESMVTAILRRSNPMLMKGLTEEQHAQYLEYLSTLLMIRDREEIPNVLCRQQPDLFTRAVKDLVASFEPMIRVLHEHVDLREHVTAVEGFITDFINVGKAKSSKNGNGFLSGWTNGSLKSDPETRTPSVEDYVTLLRRNRQLLYNFLHQVASQCPDLTEDFRVWCNATIKVFRQPRRPSPENDQPSNPTEAPRSKKRPGGAGAVSSNLQHLFSSLSPTTRDAILPAVNAHASYLSSLENISNKRMQHILDNMPSTDAPPSPPRPTSSNNSGWSTPLSWGRSGGTESRKSSPPPTVNSVSVNKQSFAGPGMFLSRWQQLLDDTVIGPATLGGKLRSGRDVKGDLAMGKTGATKEVGLGLAKLVRIAEDEAPRAPDVKVVIEALGGEFRGLVGDILKEDGRFTVPVVVKEKERGGRIRHGDKVEI